MDGLQPSRSPGRGAFPARVAFWIAPLAGVAALAVFALAPPKFEAPAEAYALPITPLSIRATQACAGCSRRSACWKPIT